VVGGATGAAVRAPDRQTAAARSEPGTIGRQHNADRRRSDRRYSRPC
jgi:hypothetical protein